MSGRLTDDRDEQLKKLVTQVSAICMSEEFRILQQELAQMYKRAHVENGELIAFQDALFSLLIQQESDEETVHTRAY
ncbi:MAG TPA: hypothetical protein VHS59_01865 [Bacillota bacterium]|nr:hypothetical protein [Bacillota bacterium]